MKTIKNPYIRSITYGVIGSIVASGLYIFLINLIFFIRGLELTMTMVEFTLRALFVGFVLSLIPAVLSCLFLTLLVKIPMLSNHFSNNGFFVIGALLGLGIAFMVVLIVAYFFGGRVSISALLSHGFILSIIGIGLGGTIGKMIYVDKVV